MLYTSSGIDIPLPGSQFQENILVLRLNSKKLYDKIKVQI
jgi:hypothetical protein